MLEKLPKKKGLKVVDYGCGTGRVSLILLSKGINVVAVDVSQESLKKLEKLNKQYKSKKWGKLTTFTEIPDEKYDIIVGADVLHHVPIDQTLNFFQETLKT